MSWLNLHLALNPHTPQLYPLKSTKEKKHFLKIQRNFINSSKILPSIQFQKYTYTDEVTTYYCILIHGERQILNKMKLSITLGLFKNTDWEQDLGHFIQIHNLHIHLFSVLPTFLPSLRVSSTWLLLYWASVTVRDVSTSTPPAKW